MLSSSLPKLNSMQALFGQSNFSSTRIFLRYTSVLASRSDRYLGNQRRKLSVSGSTCHGFNKKVSHLSVDSTLFSTGCFCQRKNMAASGSKALFGDIHVDDLITSCGNVSNFAKPSGVYFGYRSLRSCQKVSMSLKKREPTNSNVVYGYFMFDVMRRNCNSNTIVGPWLNIFQPMSSACYSTGAAPNVSFDGSLQNEQPDNSPVTSDRTTLGDRNLKLLSGSCYLPHPDKEETGGEDAHFICVDEQAIGVADGVGGWAEVGVDAGIFARELMSYSVNAIQEEPKGSIDPARVLEKAHSSTKAKGSSTACIITLADQELHAINLGDSGFIVVRDGCTVFESPVQQHGFNFTYQLESGNTGDLPSSGQVFTIPVAPGDVIIAGTDGLFDNLYNNEVTAVVVHAVRAGLGPQVAAQKIAALARQRALDRNRQTPFSTAAQEAGYRYYGGKLDDVTVVVSYISSSTPNM